MFSALGPCLFVRVLVYPKGSLHCRDSIRVKAWVSLPWPNGSKAGDSSASQRHHDTFEPLLPTGMICSSHTLCEHPSPPCLSPHIHSCFLSHLPTKHLSQPGLKIDFDRNLTLMAPQQAEQVGFYWDTPSPHSVPCLCVASEPQHVRMS